MRTPWHARHAKKVEPDVDTDGSQEGEEEDHVKEPRFLGGGLGAGG